MSALKKIMNDEIRKYQGRIYYLDCGKDMYGNIKKPVILSADWIISTQSYNHYEFELHHVIKFTHYEQNKEWYKKRNLKMCLILLPKVLHQQLENPIYELDEDAFYNKYKIHKYELLFSKGDFFNGNYPQILSKETFDEIGYDGCFDSLFEDELLCSNK